MGREVGNSFSDGFCFEGECHLHISRSTEMGNVFGGHMLDGYLYSTAEILIGEAKHLLFSREKDTDTGYPCCRYQSAVVTKIPL